MTPTMAGAFDGPFYVPPAPLGDLLAVIQLIGWTTFAVCVLGCIILAVAMVRKHHRGENTTPPSPVGGEATAALAPLGVFFLGYTILGAVGILFGLMI